MDEKGILRKLQELNLQIIRLNQQERFQEAIPLAQKALEIIKKSFGEEHPNYVTFLATLAMLYESEGAYDKAAPLYEQVLNILKNTLGESHPNYTAGLNRIAELYRSIGAYDKAEPLYIQALQIRKKTLGVSHADYAQSLNNLSALYYSMGNYEKAEPLISEALQITREIKGVDSPDYAQCLNNLADLYVVMGLYDKADPLFAQCLEFIKKTLGEDDPGYANSLIILASNYTKIGEYHKAKHLYEEAQEILKNTFGEEDPRYATLLNNLAEMHRMTGIYDKAEPLYKAAKEILKNKYGNKNLRYAAILNNQASLYLEMGKYDEAESFVKEAIEIKRIICGEEDADYALSINNLAALYLEIGDYNKAESLFKEAMEIRKNKLGVEHPDYAQSLGNLGLVYLRKKEYEKAISLFIQAKMIWLKNKNINSWNYAIILSNLAEIYEKIGEFRKAESLLIEAREIYKHSLSENHIHYAICINNLGILYSYLKTYDKAESLLFQSSEILKKNFGEIHPDYVKNLYNIAELYVTTNRIDEAFNLMKQAEKINNQLIEKIFHIGSERLLIANILSISSYTDIYLSLIKKYFSQSTSRICEAFEYVLRRKLISFEALAAQRDAILGGKYPHLCEKFDQLNKLRMHIAQKTLAGPREVGVEDHLQLLDELNVEKEYLEAELARHIPEIQLEKKLRVADRATIAHRLPPDSVLLEFFRFNEFDFEFDALKGQNPWKPAQYCAFVMYSGDPENIKMINLGEAEQIDRFIANYKSKLTREGIGRQATDSLIKQADKKSNVSSNISEIEFQSEEKYPSRDIAAIPDHDYDEEILREYGLKLYDTLFAPLHDALGESSRLIIAPDSQISTIPFEVIPAPEGGYLIDKYNIHYVGVGRDVLRFATTIPGKPEKPMIMASPDFDLCAGKGKKESDMSLPGRRSRDFSRGRKRFDRLPGTKVEGEEIGSLLNTKPLLEQEALESRIKAASSPSILHIATHGFFQSDQELADQKSRMQPGMFGDIGTQRFLGGNIENPLLRSGLALAGANTFCTFGELPPEAEDGILTAEDVTGLDLTNTDIAILSACNTGMGDVKVGEGVFGLRRAFALAGAKTLIMSLWKVPDEATQELMVDFYKRILAGTPKADALRESQLELRKKYPDPRDWGAFICQGDPGVLADLE